MHNMKPQPNAAGIRFAKYIRQVVEAGSVHPVGASFLSPIRCIRRPNRKPCKGKIGITPLLDIMRWQCSECESNGDISGWRNTAADLSECMPDNSERLSALGLPEREYQTLREVDVCTCDEAALVASGEWADSEVVISGPSDIFELLSESVAAEFNRTWDKKKRKLLDHLSASLRQVASKPDRDDGK